MLDKKVFFIAIFIIFAFGYCLYDGLDFRVSYAYQNEETVTQFIEASEKARTSPNDYELQIAAGDLGYATGNYKSAVRHFRKALVLSPKIIEAYLKLANVYRYEGKYNEAQKLLVKASDIEPKNDFVYVEMGKLYRNWGKYELAEKSFLKAIEINPKDDTIYGYGFGYLYDEIGDFQKAEEAFLKAFELNPSEFNYFALGDFYSKQKKYDQAEKMYRSALEINPDSEAHLGLGWLYFNKGDLAKAETEFTNFIENIRPKAEVYFALGIVKKEQGYFSEGEKYILTAIQLNPKNSQFYDILKAYYKTRGDYIKLLRITIKQIVNRAL